MSLDNWKVENSAHCRLISPVSEHLRVKMIDLGVGLWVSPKLPRKEVIQPHLPVRLPCYDFTPITDPTLDACLPSDEGLAQRLQVLPTFVV